MLIGHGYYLIRTVTHLGPLLEPKRGNRHCKMCFNDSVIFERILKIFKSTLINSLCILTLSGNAIFCNLSLILWSCLNVELVFSFCDMKNNLKDFFRKKLKIDHLNKIDLKYIENESNLCKGESCRGGLH